MAGNRITCVQCMCIRATLMLGVMNDCKPNKKSLQEIIVRLFS